MLLKLPVSDIQNAGSLWTENGLMYAAVSDAVAAETYFSVLCFDFLCRFFDMLDPLESLALMLVSCMGADK